MRKFLFEADAAAKFYQQRQFGLGKRFLDNLAMSEHDVERLLGSPEKVIVNKVFCNWYYNDTIGAVNFNAESRKVEGWKEP